jgi:hypothetical protein
MRFVTGRRRIAGFRLRHGLPIFADIFWDAGSAIMHRS